jgi:N-methylhydantoinase A
MRNSFDEEHKRTYGHGGKDQSVEIFNLRVRATYPGLDLQWRNFRAEDTPSLSQSRPAYFGREHGMIETPVLPRHQLGREAAAGPFLIEDMDATILVPPRCQARCDEWGNILLEVEG